MSRNLGRLAFNAWCLADPAVHAAGSLARAAAWWLLAGSSSSAGPLRMAAPRSIVEVMADELHHQVGGIVHL